MSSEPSGISRRSIVKAGLLAAAIVSAVGYRPVVNAIKEHGVEQITAERLGFSLEQLAHELDNEWLGVQGFPSYVQELGFEIKPVVNKGSSKEILVIAEAHWQFDSKVAELIDLLIEKYGFDSIGFEAYWGGPNPDMNAKRKEEAVAYLGNPVLPGPRVSQRSMIRGEMEVTLPDFHLLPDLSASPSYSRFLRQESVPAYGIEDKQLFLDVLNMEEYITLLDAIDKLSVYHGFSNGSSIPSESRTVLSALIDQLVDLSPRLGIPRFCPFDFVEAMDINAPSARRVDYNFMHLGYHEGGLPCKIHGGTFDSDNDVRAYFQKVNGQYKSFKEARERLKFSQRNISFVANIVEQMDKLGSNKSIVLVGAGHVFSDVSSFIDGAPSTLNFITPEQELQALLPYTSLAVNATKGFKLPH